MPSLPPVSAKVIADAEQFVSEFKRAENQARRSMSNIDQQVDDFSKRLTKKFQLADFGRDILKGAGLFGGFQIAESAAKLLVDHFKDAAEAAKSIADYTSKQLDITKQLIALRQTDRQKEASLEKEYAAIGNQLQMAEHAGDRVVGRAGKTVRYELTDDQKQKVKDLREEYDKLGLAIAQEKAKEKDDKAAKVTKDQEQRVRVLNDSLQIEQQSFDDIIAAQKKKNDVTDEENKKMAELAEKYKELADPTLRFKNEIAEINKLMSGGALRYDAGAKAIAAVNAAMADDQKSRINKSLEDFFGDMDEEEKRIHEGAKDAAKAAKDLGLAFTSAFEDAVVGGSKFSDVLQGLEKDLLRLFLRKQVTEPALNFLSSAFTGSSISKLFGFASGGDFMVGGQGGTDSQTVAFRATPGEQVSVRTPGQKASGTGGAQFFIDARGADRQGLAALAAQIAQLNGTFEARAVGAVLQQKFRSAGFSRAMAS